MTSKIVKNAVLISMGKVAKLELGNLDSQRDWGHSKDYVRAMHLILQHNEPDDFVIATGETHSVREFCEIVFRKLGLDYRNTWFRIRGSYAPRNCTTCAATAPRRRQFSVGSLSTRSRC